MKNFTCNVCGYEGSQGPMIGQVSAPRCSTCGNRSCIRHTSYQGTPPDGRAEWQCDKCKDGEASE